MRCGKLAKFEGSADQQVSRHLHRGNASIDYTPAVAPQLQQLVSQLRCTILQPALMHAAGSAQLWIITGPRPILLNPIRSTTILLPALTFLTSSMTRSTVRRLDCCWLNDRTIKDRYEHHSHSLLFSSVRPLRGRSLSSDQIQS